MGLDLDIGYCVLSVNLVFVSSFIVGNVEIKELQGFLIIFDIHRVLDVDGVLFIQYSLKPVAESRFLNRAWLSSTYRTKDFGATGGFFLSAAWYFSCGTVDKLLL